MLLDDKELLLRLAFPVPRQDSFRCLETNRLLRSARSQHGLLSMYQSPTLELTCAPVDWDFADLLFDGSVLKRLARFSTSCLGERSDMYTNRCWALHQPLVGTFHLGNSSSSSNPLFNVFRKGWIKMMMQFNV